MLRIGVLSDTHFHDSGQAFRFLQDLLSSSFCDVDLILHAGDMVNPDVLLAFTNLTVHAVRGNMDPPTPGIPVRKVIDAGGFRIGLIHGWGSPKGLEDRILGEFQGVDLDALVYGHSHQPVCHRRSGVLLFNPGSPTDRRSAPYCSVGILDVGKNISGTIIPLRE